MGLYRILRPLLFRLPPEGAHAASLAALRLVGALPPLAALVRRALPAVDDPVELFGLRFSNRVGLAAGYDKDAVAVRGLAALGFGHVELGTVTPLPQPGNPRPRVFRLVEDRALVNRLGFPSQGAAAVAARLAGRPRGPRIPVVGLNLGKQRTTPLEEAVEDYLALMDALAPVADYLAVNVSSPNTPELRRLQGREYLATLVGALTSRRARLAEELGRPLPLLVKLSPDLAEEELEEAAAILLAGGVDGVVATNTTIARPALRSAHAAEEGGLSGSPLAARSTAVVRSLAAACDGRLPIVAAGGVMSAADAEAKAAAGGQLVQLYTGLVYRGPALVGEVAAALRGPVSATAAGPQAAAR